MIKKRVQINVPSFYLIYLPATNPVPPPNKALPILDQIVIFFCFFISFSRFLFLYSIVVIVSFNLSE